MKVLWITNIVFPEALSLLSGKETSIGTGSWLIASSKILTSDCTELQLYVASVCSSVNTLTFLDGDKNKYILLPVLKGGKPYNVKYEYLWREINSKISPDIIHIHGTEQLYGLAYINACGSKHVVVSIQGLISQIGIHYLGGLSKIQILRNLTFHDILKGGLIAEQKRCIEKGKYEKMIIRSVNHVIGRTTWDRAHSFNINHNIKYYHCDEMLREDFYYGKWMFEKCQKHAVFVSQSYYPLKGFHILLKAVDILKEKYPDIEIRVGGLDIFNVNWYRIWGYGRLINRYIETHKLSKHISFLGNLSANRMKSEYLNCNVFVSPSSIENSPNSVCEAQILGVPTVASYVGGTMDIMKGNEENLYRYDDYEMLAYRISQIFESGEKQNDCSEYALIRHNREKFVKSMMRIYQTISKE